MSLGYRNTGGGKRNPTAVRGFARGYAFVSPGPKKFFAFIFPNCEDCANHRILRQDDYLSIVVAVRTLLQPEAAMPMVQSNKITSMT